jgi:hypothetical protein
VTDAAPPVTLLAPPARGLSNRQDVRKPPLQVDIGPSGSGTGSFHNFGRIPMTTTSDIGDKAGAQASTAADETREVGKTAGEEFKNVTGEAAAHVRNLADEARTQVEEQTRSQRDRLVSTLSTFSDDLDSMRQDGSGSQGMAADVVRVVSERSRALSQRLEGRETRELLADVRSFARRRPGAFLLGSLATGLVAGRLLRGAKDAEDTTSSGAGGDITPVTSAEPVNRQAYADTMPGPGRIADPVVPATSSGLIGDDLSAEPSDSFEPGAPRGTR